MWKDNEAITAILNAEMTGKDLFPCKCPNCGNVSAHVYFHRHNERHCGIWTWCSVCGSYAHMSGSTPSWWKNPDFIDVHHLSADPEYLDSMVKEIDEWVNNLALRKGEHLVAVIVPEDRFVVRVVKQIEGLGIGTKGVLVIKNYFVETKITFTDSNGTSTEISIDHDKIESYFEIIE